MLFQTDLCSVPTRWHRQESRESSHAKPGTFEYRGGREARWRVTLGNDRLQSLLGKSILMQEVWAEGRERARMVIGWGTVFGKEEAVRKVDKWRVSEGEGGGAWRLEEWQNIYQASWALDFFLCVVYVYMCIHVYMYMYKYEYVYMQALYPLSYISSAQLLEPMTE